MPIYGYQCQACGHEFELMQKMSDPVPTDCPVCGKPEVRKQLSAAGFQLKGSGWYVTDFKGGPKSGKDTQPASGTKAVTDTKSGSAAKSGTESKSTPDKGGTESGPKTGSSSS